MERREDALREALADNSNETERWQKYKEENEGAIANLDKFIKNLSVEVMVPIGRKAFIPGELIHTNEVLVGHFQGYFSKCSAHKAKEICQLRLRLAEDHLKKLEKEAEMWQNKLEKPYMEGALPSAEQLDIMEVFEEEEHNKWMERHKIMVRNMKLKERELMEKVPKDISIDNEALLEELRNDLKELSLSELNEDALSKLLSGSSKSIDDPSAKTNDDSNEQPKPLQEDDDIMKMWEDMEKLEEENNELQQVDIDATTNDVVQQMLSGSVKIPKDRKRISHNNPMKSNDEMRNLKNMETEAKNTTPSNIIPKKSALKQSNLETMKEVEEEVEIVRHEANYLPLEDRIGFYEFQIQIMQEKSRKLSKRKSNYQLEKTRLMDVIVTLNEDLDALLEKLDLMSDAEEDVEKKKKRRISFAQSEETLEFSQNETVAEMLLPKDQKPKQSLDMDMDKDHKRDVVTLDEPIIPLKSTPAMPTKQSVAHFKKSSILDKVAQNLDYIMENQSEQDVDLIGNILNASAKHNKTLQIHFKHSEANPPSSLAKNVDEEPGTPADFYKQYIKIKGNKAHQTDSVFVNAYEGEDKVKIPLLNEAERRNVFEDPRTAFSLPGALNLESASLNVFEVVGQPLKPIILNKSAVELETHHVDKENANKKSNQKKKPQDENDFSSAYLKVMNEVTEREMRDEPEPLPQGNFIDANTPKKRVSRFKKERFSAFGKQESP